MRADGNESPTEKNTGDAENAVTGASAAVRRRAATMRRVNPLRRRPPTRPQPLRRPSVWAAPLNVRVTMTWARSVCRRRRHFRRSSKYLRPRGTFFCGGCKLRAATVRSNTHGSNAGGKTGGVTGHGPTRIAKRIGIITGTITPTTKTMATPAPRIANCSNRVRLVAAAPRARTLTQIGGCMTGRKSNTNKTATMMESAASAIIIRPPDFQLVIDELPLVPGYACMHTRTRVQSSFCSPKIP